MNDILSKLDKALNKGNDEVLKEMAEYFGLEVNEGLGDGIMNSIKKRMKLVKDACNYIADMASKVAKNTGDKQKKAQVEKEVKDVMKELDDLEKLTSEMLDYMFGNDTINVTFRK